MLSLPFISTNVVLVEPPPCRNESRIPSVVILLGPSESGIVSTKVPSILGSSNPAGFNGHIPMHVLVSPHKLALTAASQIALSTQVAT